ncbi:cytochrome b5-like heme/steroid binding domain-containing protein [Amylostereum chailletii]|nr:cytochrome b5-like heme/steroid binding domain-containing protein [Amylostereum chailletii]
MASYLRSWLPSSLPLVSETAPGPTTPDSPTTPTAPTVTLPDEDDAPPAFPAVNSAQRAASSSSPPSLEVPRILTDSTLMPPPPAPTKLSSEKKRAKVALAPGHSPLDWASLKTSGEDLRGGATTLMRIPPSVLKQHRSRDDAWSAFNGKVYNITPYLDFHPGGVKELMRVAGRDGTKLFAATHAWVNVDFMLDACLVGFLVSEPAQD